MKSIRYLFGFVVIALGGWADCGRSLAQSEANPPAETGRPDQAEIDKSLDELLQSMPELDAPPATGMPATPPAPTPAPTGKPNLPNHSSEDGVSDSVPVDVVTELQDQVDLLTRQSKLSESEQAQLKRLKIQLRIAKTLRQQFKKPRPKRNARSPEDTFVVANLEVVPGSNVLDVRFQTIEGELESVRAMLDYVCQTPREGFRDFRIISRHSTGSDAGQALEDVRRDYDLAKRQQEQYLQYIAQQRAALARIAAARRC